MRASRNVLSELQPMFIPPSLRISTSGAIGSVVDEPPRQLASPLLQPAIHDASGRARHYCKPSSNDGPPNSG